MKEYFSLHTVRKKIVVVSKTAGFLLIVSYIAAARLPFPQDISFLLWTAFIIILICLVDYLLGRFISDPICELCETAHRIAQLDFSASCRISSKDEFGELAENLNKMSRDLQHTLEKLERANISFKRAKRINRPSFP